jgi:hypothetical protein
MEGGKHEWKPSPQAFDRHCGANNDLGQFPGLPKQKSDLERVKKELKEDLAQIQAAVEKAYERLSGDLGTAAVEHVSSSSKI